MKTIFSALALLLFCSTAAAAECTTPDEWLAQVRKDSPGFTIKVKEDDKGTEVPNALDWVNNHISPKTDYKADRIVVTSATDPEGASSSYYVGALFLNGCWVHGGRFDAYDLAKMFDGDPA